MRKVSLLFFVLSFTFVVNIVAQKKYSVQSPDGQLNVSVTIDKSVSYSLKHNGEALIQPSVISMQLNDGKAFGINPKVNEIRTKAVTQSIQAPIYKRSVIADRYNELQIKFKEDYELIFRAYNDGMAYRFVSTRTNDFLVVNEEANFNFGSDQPLYVPYVNRSTESFEKQFFNSFENTYTYIPVSQWDVKRLAFLPIVAEASGGKKICITESDLESYPGMYLHNPDGSTSLKGVFAPYPKKVHQGGHNQLQMLVDEREAYIAKCAAKRNFPWRVIIVSSNDKELADNDMVYKLAAPSRLKDASWVNPGKVAWEWWNDWNLYGVNFKTGINNDTYRHYIDFASRYKIEYVILDEGWAVNQKADLMQVVPEINLKELVDYAASKNVGIILWAGYHAFNRDMETVCKHYSEMGVKGFKIDFMDRDDQEMVDFYYRAAETTAKYQLMADFHGAYKPTGIHRTYPNVINFEGVYGLEQMKWSGPEVDQVTYDVTIPFIRQVAGPMDYTQGAMRNANKRNYRSAYSEPMSQGTRCRQLAEYVIFESPLNMLCDSPSNYDQDVLCTTLIASFPTVWDQTIALNGEIGKYVTIARQKGKTWYVGSMTNWDKRELELDLSFLGDGHFKADIYIDGMNAAKAARDYTTQTITVPTDRKLKISMAPGGGFVAKIMAE